MINEPGRDELADDPVVTALTSATVAEEEKSSAASSDAGKKAAGQGYSMDPMETIGRSIDRHAVPITLRWEVVVAWGDDVDLEAANDSNPGLTMDHFAEQLSAEAWARIKDKETLLAEQMQAPMESGATDALEDVESDFEVLIACDGELSESRTDWRQYLRQGNRDQDLDVESDEDGLAERNDIEEQLHNSESNEALEE